MTFFKKISLYKVFFYFKKINSSTNGLNIFVTATKVVVGRQGEGEKVGQVVVGMNLVLLMVQVRMVVVVASTFLQLLLDFY